MCVTKSLLCTLKNGVWMVLVLYYGGNSHLSSNKTIFLLILGEQTRILLKITGYYVSVWILLCA